MNVFFYLLVFLAFILIVLVFSWILKPIGKLFLTLWKDLEDVVFEEDEEREDE